MLEGAIKLEELRQKIEKSGNDAGSTSDFIDHGKPNAKQLKDAQDFIARKNKEVEVLKLELHELITQTSPLAIEEWVAWHNSFLEKILSEDETNSHSKTRLRLARQTMQAWEKVRNGEQEFVSINWHFLKDYKKEVESLIHKDWWKFWK